MKIDIGPLWLKLGIEDEVSLVQQLYDVYHDADTVIGELVHLNNPQAENYFRVSSHVCGFRNKETIDKLVLNKVITPMSTDGGYFPYFDKTIGADIYKAVIHWDEWVKYAGFLHDKEADEPYGLAKQKQFFKNVLIKIDKDSQEKEVTISERVLGVYSDHVSLAQQIRGDDSPDHFYQFYKILRELEKEGFLTIVKVDYDFTAFPIPPEEDMDRLENGVFIDEDANFYPAEHCKATVILSNSQSTEAKLLRESEKYAIPTEKLLAAFEEDAEIKPTEQLYQDEIQLISKLLQICSPDFLEVELCTPALLAQSDSLRAGFDNQTMIETLKRKKIFTQLKEIPSKSPAGQKYYKATVNYPNLLKFAEDLHDEVESLKGEVYGFDLQKISLLRLIKEMYNQSSQDGEVTISESILGSYQQQNSTNNPAGISLVRPDQNRSDIRYQFMHALRALEKEGHFIIKSVDFDFYAKPIPTSDSKKRAIWAVGGDHLPTEYYAPAHCKVTLSLSGTESIQITTEDRIIKWEDLSLDTIAGLAEFNRVAHGFKLSKPHFKVLKRLINSGGEEVTYEQFFEAVDPTLVQDPKAGKEFIRQKIRDIRKYFKINRKTDRKSDIFLDTGNGFRLQKLQVVIY